MFDGFFQANLSIPPVMSIVAFQLIQSRHSVIYLAVLINK